MIVLAYERRKTLRRVLLLAIALISVGESYVAGARLGMQTTLSTRHVYYSLPYAVSHRYFGTHGYVILREVAELFIHTHPHVTNDTIAQAIALKPSPDRLMYFPGDDKGYADFALLAFNTFELRIESLYYMWFSLYLISILVFAAVFWQSETRLAALAIATLAIYMAFFALPLTFELQSIHNPRAFGAISLIAALHVIFTMVDRQDVTPVRLLAVGLQSILIALSIDVRSTEWWQVLAIAGAALWLVAGPRVRVATLWPCALLVVALVGLDSYQRAAVDQVYEQSQLRHRIFWHNVGIGFALNPALAHKYSLFIDDTPMMALVRKRLLDTNRADQVGVVFNPVGHEDYQFSGFAKDYVQYERVAREVVLSIIWNNRADAIHTFIVDKPKVLARQLAWAAGYQGYSADELYNAGQIGALVKESDRVQKSIYLTPLRFWVIAGFLATAWLSGAFRPSSGFGALCVVAGWIGLISALPVIVAYPNISSIGAVLFTFPFFVLAFVLWLTAAGASFITTRSVAAVR